MIKETKSSSFALEITTFWLIKSWITLFAIFQQIISIYVLLSNAPRTLFSIFLSFFLSFFFAAIWRVSVYAPFCLLFIFLLIWLGWCSRRPFFSLKKISWWSVNMSRSWWSIDNFQNIHLLSSIKSRWIIVIMIPNPYHVWHVSTINQNQCVANVKDG